MTSMTLEGASGAYRVGDLLASKQEYRVYLATEVNTGHHCLLQVATSPGASGGLDRAAYLLNRLAKTAGVYDASYIATHDGRHLHYDRLYPTIVESFVPPTQGRRRINILSLADIDDVLRVVPLSNLRDKDRLRVDPQTSAWIMGRLLKMLAFIHGEGIANRALSAKNILLDPKQHFAVTLDWTNARMFPDSTPTSYIASDIADAASAVLASIGGDEVSWTGNQAVHVPYVSLLQDFADGTQDNTEHALDQFYKLVRSEYGEAFHPFTTLPL